MGKQTRGRCSRLKNSQLLWKFHDKGAEIESSNQLGRVVLTAVGNIITNTSQIRGNITWLIAHCPNVSFLRNDKLNKILRKTIQHV